VRLAQCAGKPENEAFEPYLSDIGVLLEGFLLKNAYHILQQKGLGGLYPSCDDFLSFAVVAAEFWSLQKKCGSQRTNRVRQTLGARWPASASCVCDSRSHPSNLSWQGSAQ